MGTMLLRTLWFGSFLLRDDEVVQYTLFPKNTEEIAKRYLQIRDGNILDEEKELAAQHSHIFVLERRLKKLPDVEFITGEEPDGCDVLIKPECYDISGELLKKALVLVYSKKLSKTLREREIIELIEALDDLNQTINLLGEREQEWSKVYGDEDSPRIFNNFQESIISLEKLRENLTADIEGQMQKRNPNLSGLVGELLGARLIALAGGRERLARFTSGTIQILGAETAFFRFRKEGTGMPKHGVIFQHPFIKGSKKKIRGKIARMLAAKIAIAARIDYYSGRDDGDILRQEVEEKIKKL